MRITLDLLRRRSEHNDGCLTDLKEIAIHQQEIEKIEVIGDCCRQLEILYLCNNYISKIENLFHCKNLQYINLAVNSITEICGLEGCEMLQRLDLTLNFIADMTCVENLRANAFLQTLHLTGNPCTKTQGYRAFVVHTLPHLTDLDGESVVKSERIVARQDEPELIESVEEDAMKSRQAERIKAEMVARGVDPFPPKYNEKGERVYGHSPEERMQILRDTQEEEKKRKNPPIDPNSISAIHAELNKKPVKLTAAEEIAKHGRLLMRNEAKFPFTFDESGEEVVITVDPGKYIATSLINIEVETTYVRIMVKDKLVQFPLSVEVAPELVKVQRASTTGQLKINVPLALHLRQEREEKRNRYAHTTDID